VQVELIGGLDRDVAWNGQTLYAAADFEPDRPVPTPLMGAAAAVRGDAKRGWRLLRDPLGINKLFWSATGPGRIVVSARPYRLVATGVAFDSIRAFPRGFVLDLLEPEARITPLSGNLGTRPPAADMDADAVAVIALGIRRRLDDYLQAVRAALPSRRAFVCLSGGLDSTGISIVVRDHFPDATFVSFDLNGPGQPPSDDRRTARRIADGFGVPLMEVDVRFDELLELLDVALLEGIDWRPFNVHAALVNAALAVAIADSLPDHEADDAPLVFTGDLANELLADYAPEVSGGVVHYALPDLAPGELRQTLVDGLDTSHREVGIFGASGLTTIQPYAAATDLYLNLPDHFLGRPDRKQSLSAAIFGSMLPRYVLERPKVRAQVGGAGGGVLAACIERGIDDAWLRSRFAELHRTDSRSLGRFIRAGRYRSAFPNDPVEAVTTGG